MEVTVVCKNCGKEFKYNHTRGVKRSYCCESCQRNGIAKNGYKRNRRKLKERANVTKLESSILGRYGSKCAICGWELSNEQFIRDKKGRMLVARGNEIHHIVALEDGGTSTDGNLILLCPNHHKMANAGIISAEELKTRYWRGPLTDAEIWKMKSDCVDRVSKAISDAMEELRHDQNC